jgi:hypothetical protein
MRMVHPTMGNSPKDALYGYFVYGDLNIISSGEILSPAQTRTPPRILPPPWEHVSVSLPGRTPSWDEMSEVKDLFWTPLETVIQFHPTRIKYVNTHPYCLHLWRRSGTNAELPPEWAI